MRSDTPSPALIRRRFLFAMLCSAAVVVVARLFYATDTVYDLTLQIQTAQNLLAGRGFTFFWPTSAELTEPFQPLVMTHFAAGYSLYAATMLSAGAGIPTLVKIPGAILTLLGWWGWGRLALTCMHEGLAANARWRACGYWLAIVSPLLFSHPWGGTDFILWAAVPWTLELLTRTPEARGRPAVLFDAIAGLIAGTALLARYQSAFLVMTAALVIAGQSASRPALLTRRTIAFAAGLLPGVAIQSCVFWLAADARPGGVSVNLERIGNLGARVWETLPSLAGASQTVLFWLPPRYQFWQDPAPGVPGIALAAAVLLLPTCLVLWSRRLSIGEALRDRRAIGAAMLLALPFFLWVCSLFSTSYFARYLRYYGSLRPLVIFLAFQLAAAIAVSRPARAAQLMARAYLLGFLLVSAAEVGLMLVSARGETWRQAFLGALHTRDWPSSGLVYETSPARRAVLDAMRDDPRAILITTREPWFYADPDVDRSRVMRWDGCHLLAATHVTGPARLLFLVYEDPSFAALPSAPRPAPVPECLSRLPVFTLNRRFEDENLLFLETTVPDGTRVRLR